MAPLASIPEANTSLRSTFETRRPRSRVVFLSRRPTRPRCSPRRLLSKRRPCADDDGTAHGHVPLEASHRHPPHGRHLPAGTEPESSAWNRVSSDASPEAPGQLRKSESPFDLDSFPHPPSSNNYSYSDNTRPLITTHPSGRDAAHKPPLALSQRKLLASGLREPASIRRSLTGAAVDLLNPVKRQSVNSALVAAVSRSIVQQLHLFSTTVQQSSHLSQQQQQPSSKSSGSYMSAQKQSVNRFTRDLEAYAEQASAKGKILRDTPPPSADGATLHTVTELLPFRSQLRAAGLAVTSKDQASRVPKYLEDLHPGMPPPGVRRRRGCGHAVPAQVDGKNDSGSSGPAQSINTEISFAEPHKMDEFRLALIDEAPARKKKGLSGKKRTGRRCLPCFPAEDDFTTDTDWAHFKAPVAQSNNHVQQMSAKQRARNLPAKSQARAPLDQGYMGSALHSPFQQPTSRAAVDMFGNQDGRTDQGGPHFITTGRRHSLAMPKLPLETTDCSIRHRQRPSKEGQAQVHVAARGHAPRAVDFSAANGKMGREPSAKGVKPRTRMDDTSVPGTEARLSGRRPGLETPLDVQVDGQRAPRPRRPQRPSRPSRPSRPPRPPRSLSASTKRKSVFQYDPYHVGICCPKSRGVPAKLTARPNIPRRTSSIQGSHDSADLDFDDREISDRDVLRGLHVAASAACNEEIDAFVRNRTGLRVRRFLADLMVLETLTAVRPGEDDEQHARRRRAEMRKLKQQVRRSREVAMTGGLV
ncbi:hypothetical protein E4U42_005531 [Claviceps africana]|uniref:Uncharacterized protein n=1 Tax=Claviceps africana TaxID=83212 RepID=A0A8K0J9P0_9HYPO|nr:hypothetical protein E4U42_005531 [Claviceps africana]